MAQFAIRLYATGDLAEELTQYQGELFQTLGRPVDLPYCPLVDNFGEEGLSTDDCIAQLDTAIMGAPKQNDTVVEVIEPHYSVHQHQLELSSAWVHAVITALAGQLQRAQVQICPKEALYLLLALPEDESQHKTLQPLAEAVNWTAKAGWDMQLYQGNGDDWMMEGSWPIQQP
ncbi:MAG: hypothetical protein WBA10_02940 [Elainellaceae cyanobacterium]